MTNSPLRNSIKAQMSKQSMSKPSVLSKGSMTSNVVCKRAIKKIPDNGKIHEPSLRYTPSTKGIPSVPIKTRATRSENLLREKERTLQKIDSFPRHKQKDSKMMNGLYSTLIQINHTDLVRSPYFGSLSKILRSKELNRGKEVKTQKLNESKKLPTLKNSTCSMKSNKSIQTTGANSKQVKTKGKSTSSKTAESKVKCSSTKLPIIVESRGKLKQKPSNNNLKSSSKVGIPQSSKLNVQIGNTVNLRPPAAKYLGYWDNEIRNYYNWTSFCLMRRYRSDTKKLKEQLKCLGREGCSINDVIWREAETFRKNIEKDRKKLDEVLKVSTKDNSSKKKRCTNKKLSGKNCDSLPAIRTPPERKKCVALVPPPSASESLYIYRKRSRPPTPTLSEKTADSRDLPDKQVARSVSDQSIFPGGNSGQFVSKGLQYRSQISDPSFDATDTNNNSSSLNEQNSKFKSKFTLKSERLSFVHLKKAVR